MCRIKHRAEVKRAMHYLAYIRLPPHQLQKLGLSENWTKHVSPKFVERALMLIEKYKTLLEALAKL